MSPASHWPRFATLATLSFAILFQYQNCAPSKQTTSSSSSSAPALADSDNIVHAMGTGDAAPSVRLNSAVVRLGASQSETSVSGTCTAHTPELDWSLRDPESGEAYADGSAACLNDAFDIEVALNQTLACNKVYLLQVNEAQATLTKDCQN